MTDGRCVRRGRPRGVERAGDARPGRARARSSSPRCTGSATAGSGCPTGSTGTSSASTPTSSTGLRAAARDGPPGGLGDRLLGRRLRAARRARRAAGQPAALPRPAHRRRDRRRARQARTRPGSTASPGCSSCRSTRSTSSPPSPALDGRRRRCWCRTCSATGSPAVRSPRRPTPPPPACSTPAPAAGRRRSLEALGLPAGLLPDVIAAGRGARPGSPARSAPRSGWTTRCRSPRSGRTTPRRPSSACPPATDRFGYISCGTWGLVGVELDAPVLTEDSRQANFTNERGVDGTIRYLRNVMGLWLLSESMRTWSLRGRGVDLDDVLAGRGRAARGRPAHRPRRPGVPAARRHARADRPASPAPAAGPGSPRPWCAASSTASPLAFAAAIGRRRAALRATRRGRAPRRRRLAERAAVPAHRGRRGRPVVAGPVEATALGNVLVQARTHGVLSGDLAALRGRVRAASRLHRYEPR